MRLWRLIPPITIAACSSLAAVSASNLLEANHLADTAAPFVAPSPRVKTTETTPHTKNGEALRERNMFCSACSPDLGTPNKGPSLLTKRPLRLVATHLADNDEDSFASVINTQSHRQGAYQLGSQIPDAGVVEAITREYLEFRNAELGVERIVFDASATQAIPASKAASARFNGTKPTIADEYVRVVDATHVQVDRALVAKIQGNPGLAGARFRPMNKDGRLNGVKLYAVRNGSVAHKLGLRNGDAVLEVNSVRLNSMEAGLELMGELHTRDHWSFEILRRGKPVSLSVELQ